MRVLSIAIPFVALAAATACGSLEQMPTPSSEQARPHTDTPLTAAQQARIAFLRKQLVASGYPTDALVVLDDLFALVATIEMGRLSPDRLNHVHFYFRNQTGLTSEHGTRRQFRCSQVLESPPAEGEKMYKALYGNPLLPLTVSVMWRGTQPLVGQQLNSDFLTFVAANTYPTTQGVQRSELVFARPKWVRENGATE